MRKLTRNEIMELASLPITNPEVEIFRTRLLIAITIGLGYGGVSSINGQDIEGQFLVIKNDDGKLSYKPLHPIIINIFKAYNNHMPSFDPNEFKKLARDLATEFHKEIELDPKDKEAVEGDFVIRLLFTVRSISTTIEHMRNEGISDQDAMFLIGARLVDPKDHNPDPQKLQEVFGHRFYDHLRVLALHHNVEIDL
jgi:hypothetical protein